MNGITTTQNINNALQSDQALKICKMSLAIDKKIEAGENFDKLFAKLNEEGGIKPDIILIDSRTGFNDIIGTAIQYFSDVIVGFFGSNE